MRISNPEVEAGDTTDGIVGYKERRARSQKMWMRVEPCDKALIFRA